MPNMSEGIGFIKVDVPRCAGKTKRGEPCRAPAAGGTEWCVNHRKVMMPGWVQPMTKREIRELAVRERTAEILAKHEKEDRLERKKHGRRYRKNLIDAIAEEMELHPKHIVQIVHEGLAATKTVRQRVLNEDGTQAAVPHVWIDEKTGLTHMESEAVFEDVEVVDHPTRLAYLREVADRLYGRPAQRKDGGDGGNGANVNVNITNLLASVAQLERDPDSYYARLPGASQPVIEAGPGEVVSSPNGAGPASESPAQHDPGEAGVSVG